MAAEAVADDEELLVADVCIVGAGPAGITIASELHNSGISVCLLEAGGRDVEQRFRRQNHGESDGYPMHRLRDSRVRAFGGALRHPHFGDRGGWAVRPLDPIDFGGREGRPDFGWPFNRDHLDSYYTRAARICAVRPFDEVATVWSKQVSSDGQLIKSSPELEPAIFQYTRPAFHHAWQDLSTSSNVRLLLETRAVEIRVDSTGRRVNSIVAVRGSRDRVVIRPRLLVFAAGGIENARLLLSANAGRGLGNEHDLVGRYFAERLWLHAGHVVLSERTSLDQLSSFHGPEGADLGGGLRVAEEVQRERNLLNVAFFLIPRPAPVTSDAVRSLLTLRKAIDRRPFIPEIGWHAKNVLTGVRDLANLGKSRFVSSPPTVLTLRAQGEQAPNRESRVTLGSRRDDLGVPVPRVTWRMVDDDLRSIEASAQVVDSVLRSTGLGRVEWTARLDSTTLIEGLYHHLGTTRMHADRRQGVVDADCRVHSVDNLFVTGSSVFPSYGASNPTLTIVAIAVRLADRLREVLNQNSVAGADISRN